MEATKKHSKEKSCCERPRCGPGRPPDPDRTRKRRESILREAVRHFAREGFSQTDVGKIAEAAGCSKGTVYNYFSSKCELFRESVDHVMHGLLEATTIIDVEDPIERFGMAVRSFLAYFGEHPEYIELLIQERAHFKDRKTPTFIEYRKSHNARTDSPLHALIDSGLFRPVPVERTLDIISNLLYGTIFTNYFAGHSMNLEQQAADITDLLLKGLLSPQQAAK